MATTKRKDPTKSEPNPNNVTVTARDDDDKAALIAQAALRPSLQAAATIRAFPLVRDESAVTIEALAAELQAHIGQVKTGNLGRAEAMLTAQAHTLDAIFGQLARRAASNMGEYLGAAETYLRLALKAQSQCRTTLETLAAIKNPAPIAFVRQANIAAGPQQVNNGLPASAPPRTREIESEPNKLLEAENGERLDSRATGTAIRGDPEMATVGALDGTKNRHG